MLCLGSTSTSSFLSNTNDCQGLAVRPLRRHSSVVGHAASPGYHHGRSNDIQTAQDEHCAPSVSSAVYAIRMSCNRPRANVRIIMRSSASSDSYRSLACLLMPPPKPFYSSTLRHTINLTMFSSRVHIPFDLLRLLLLLRPWVISLPRPCFLDPFGRHGKPADMCNTTMVGCFKICNVQEH